MRIGTTPTSNLDTRAKVLHPAFGLDEDWNSDTKIQLSIEEAKLHPAFGLDEDWNDRSRVESRYLQRLHPAFGLDEDWND